MCRIALHLQLTAVSVNCHEHQERADTDTTAMSSVPRAVRSIQTRQSSAERDVYAEQQQQQAAAAAASSGAGLVEAAAEGAVVTSCEVVQKLLQQLEELGTSGVITIMVRICDAGGHVCVCLCVCMRFVYRKANQLVSITMPKSYHVHSPCSLLMMVEGQAVFVN